MFYNYLVTAWRNITRHKLYAAINIGGLAIAFAATILISLFIIYEASYEDWIPGADKIYRMDLAYYSDETPGEIGEQYGVSMGPLKAALEKDFAEVDQVTRRAAAASTFVRDGQTFAEDYFMVDDNFFKVFGFSFIHGDLESALAGPGSLVLSESVAKKHFGDENPVGKTMETAGGTIFKVTGVYKDFPRNTDIFSWGGMFSYLDVEKYGSYAFLSDWRYNSISTFFTLKDGASIETIKPRLDDFLDRNMPLGANGEKPSEGRFLVPLALSDLYLYGTGAEDTLPGGGIKINLFFGVIGVLILFIAGFNYLNSSTALASMRAKEISMRKVVGAGQKQLIRQFLGESILIAFLAFLTSLVIVQMSLPWMDAFLGKPVSLNFLGGSSVATYAVILVPLIGMGAGIYPAFFLSRYKPSEIFMDKQINNPGGFTVRSLLVTLQFAASIGLIVVTLVVIAQHAYSISGDLGFEYEDKVILDGVGSSYVQPRTETLLAQYRNLPGVTEAALSYSYPASGRTDTSPVSRPGQVEDSIDFITHAVGFDYFKTYGVELLAGRTLSPAYAMDTITVPEEATSETIAPGSAVINETALKTLGFDSPDQALGQTVRVDLADGTGLLDLTIVGIVADFKELIVRQKVLPGVYFNHPSHFNYLTLSLEPGYGPALLEQIDGIWNSTLPDQLVEREFLDESLRLVYQATETQATMLSFFSGLAIIISCLGLYGLAAIAAIRRTKEIGIRKVFGATVPRIVMMMLRQFSHPVILANLVAWPIAWLYLDSWLAEFAYHIDLSPSFFVFAGFVSLMVASFAVGGSTFKVARTHPIKALRYE